MSRQKSVTRPVKPWTWTFSHGLTASAIISIRSSEVNSRLEVADFDLLTPTATTTSSKRAAARPKMSR